MTTTPITPEDELPAPEALQELEAAAPQDPRSDAERERDEFKDGWMRAKADFANYKRDEADRIASAIAHGLGSMIDDLLRVMDSFALARTTLEPGSPAEKGIDMIRAQFLDVLRRYGVEPLDPQELLGKDFDPALAEAIGTVPSPDHAEGTVTSVAQEGYRVNGKVFRPARVYVAAAPTQ